MSQFLYSTCYITNLLLLTFRDNGQQQALKSFRISHIYLLAHRTYGCNQFLSTRIFLAFYFFDYHSCGTFWTLISIYTLLALCFLPYMIYYIQKHKPCIAISTCLYLY